MIVRVQFLFDGAMVTDEMTVFFINTTKPPSDSISMTITALFPIPEGVESVDTLRFYVQQSAVGMTTTLTGIYADETIRLTFAPDTTSIQLLPLPVWVGEVSVQNNQTTPWELIVFDEPVPASALRVAAFDPGDWFINWSGANHSASLEMQLILDDLTMLNLDDWLTPAQGQAPPADWIP